MKCFHEVCEMMTDGLVDIVSFGESKLDETMSDSVIAIPNFKAYRHDVSRVAHGLITYIRSDIPHFRRKDLENIRLNYQCIIIEVWIHKQKWFFVSLYKPPSVNDTFFINDVMYICDQMLLESDNIVLNGDLNINMLNKGNKLEEFCHTYGFANLVKEPTCFKSLDNPSLIDVILVMKPKRFYKCLTFDTGLSDCHKMVHQYQSPCTFTSPKEDKI
jgi:exonuclease III